MHALFSEKSSRTQGGFTAVELLITLFIAVAFLGSGYTIYSVVIRNGGEARQQAQASNIAYEYLRRYSSSATNPCTVKNPLSGVTQPTFPSSLPNASVSIVITCPQTNLKSLSKVQSTVTYGSGKKAIHAIYVTQ